MKKLTDILKESKNEVKNLNHIIDYTTLNDNIDVKFMKDFCDEAVKEGYYGVCVKSDELTVTRNQIKRGDNLKLIGLIDFPDGKLSTREKMTELKRAILNGVDEIDIVIDYEKFIKIFNSDENENDLEQYQNDLREFVIYCHGENSVVIKFIIESDAMDYKELKEICNMCQRIDVDYIMTSTGFYDLEKQDDIETKLEKVKYMKNILGDRVLIKVSGGVKTYEDVLNCVKSGADRIGTSAKILYY